MSLYVCKKYSNFAKQYIIVKIRVLFKKFYTKVSGRNQVIYKH